MGMIRTGYACRKHSTETHRVHILANEGSGFQCENGCKFVDNDELLNSDPIKVQLGKPPAKVQPGTVSIPVLVPSELKDRLQARFGDKLNASVSSLLGVMLDGDAFVVCGPEQLTIAKLLGSQVKNSVELSSEVGKIIVERDDARKKCEELEKRTGGGKPMVLAEGTYRVILDKKVSDLVKERAKENNATPAEWMASAMAVILNNGWL